MNIDVRSVDEALSTTRAVRLRLDLDRPVDIQIIYDCIDVAEQAPTGGNQSSRRWVIVTDAKLKASLADLYMQAAGDWMVSTNKELAGTGHPQEKTMASAAYLAENLAAVPAIVIPTIVGIHDGSGKPGLFDSVIQAAWSFCLALRARGLGTAWTSAIFAQQDEVMELLGIPQANTPIAMLPVAWTKGTDFKPAQRTPARQIASVDNYAHTWLRGPSDPPRYSDGPGTFAEIDIDAAPSVIWKMMTDISFGAEFSEEFDGARWADGVVEPALGAQFIGTNTNEAMGTWEVPCFVNRFVPEREFGWVTSDVDNPGAQWCFELYSIAGTYRLRYTLQLGPGPSGLTAFIESRPELESRAIFSRIRDLRRNMMQVLEGMKVSAEAAG